MDQQRHNGYVTGVSYQPDKNPVWKVRVKDEESPQNGQRLVVASAHGQLTLARGLNVNFLIGSVDDATGQPVLRAVDVKVNEPSPSTQSKGQKNNGS